MISKILAIAKQTARENLYYRFDLILYIFNFIVEITVYVFIWLAIYNNTGISNGMTLQEITTYYILVVSLDPIVSWGINERMGIAIREGEVLRELLNPISYFKYYFGVRLGELQEAGIVGIITFIICIMLFGVMLPQGILNLIFFIIMIALAVLVVYFFELILGMSAFYTDSIWGVEIFKRSVITIFSGMLAPLTMFPEAFQKIANILPFKDCIYTPINIYFGKLSNIEILQTILKQGIWILILYIIARLIFKKAIKKITINGG